MSNYDDIGAIFDQGGRAKPHHLSMRHQAVLDGRAIGDERIQTLNVGAMA